MTNPDYTAVAALMDRSGSMQSVRERAEQALRGFITEQRTLPGRCTVRLADFDDTYRTIYPSTPIAEVPDYVLEPRGMTALLDAVGKLVTDFGAELAALPEDERPGKVLVVIQTDGYENRSSEWTPEGVRALVTQQREQFAWDFLFLGASEDAIDVGTGMGVAPSASLSYAGTGESAAMAVAAASAYVGRARAGMAPGFTDAERRAARGEPG